MSRSVPLYPSSGMKMISQIHKSRPDTRILRLSTGIGVEERRWDVSLEFRWIAGMDAVSRDAAPIFLIMKILRMLLKMLANKNERCAKQNGRINYVLTTNKNESEAI